jgi:hypothetical protein
MARAWQDATSRGKKRFSVIVVHRRAGKSEVGVVELLHEALHAKSTDANSGQPLYVYLAPYLKQAKSLAWDRLKHYARRLHLVPNESELSVTFPHNNAKIMLCGADNPNALRGIGLDGVVVDELKDVKPEVWYEVLLPALADRKGWALFIGTPKGVNLLTELYYYGQKRSDWYTAVWTVYQTGVFTDAEIEELRAQMGENEFKREFLCDMTASGEDQLISIGLCEDAARRTIRTEDYDFAPKILGVDVARFGDDRSVLCPRQGLVCHPPKVFRGLDNMALTGQVVAAIKKWKPDAVFIDAGGGAGIIDRLRQLGYDVHETNFGARATDQQFANKRAEMWHGIKTWLDAGGVIPDITELKQDLSAPNYSYTAKNQIILESKDDLKKRILRSPDMGDALALTFAEHIAPRETPEQVLLGFHPNQARAVSEYDPAEVY